MNRAWLAPAHPLDALDRYHARPVLQRLCVEYGVTTSDVLGRSKSRTVVRCRHHFWRLLRDTLDLSYPELGRILGVDHTTVLDALKKFRHEDGRP